MRIPKGKQVSLIQLLLFTGRVAAQLPEVNLGPLLVVNLGPLLAISPSLVVDSSLVVRPWVAAFVRVGRWVGRFSHIRLVVMVGTTSLRVGR